MFIFIQLLFVYIIISLNKCPLGECDSPLQYFRIIPLTSLSGHIQLDEYIMGECDSPLHIFTHTYLASHTGELHSPHNISVPNTYSTISSNSWANSIRPYIFTHISILHPVRANRIRPLIYPSPIYIPPFYSMGEFDSPLHIYTHIYSAFRTGESHSPPISIRPQSAFAPIFIHPNIYIPSFHPFQWANAIRPYIGTHIYIIQIPYGRIAFAPISIRPIYFPTTSRINLKTLMHTPQNT